MAQSGVAQPQAERELLSACDDLSHLERKACLAPSLGLASWGLAWDQVS